MNSSNDPRKRLRPRVLAGSTLGLAGIAAGLVLALGGTTTTTPAFASATAARQANGDVLVTVSSTDGVVPADLKLQHMGIQEQVNFGTAPGPAVNHGPITCLSVVGPGVGFNTPSGYQVAPPKGPRVKMMLGSDNTGVTPAGDTVHLANCVFYPEGPGTELGNSGQKFLNKYGR